MWYVSYNVRSIFFYLLILLQCAKDLVLAGLNITVMDKREIKIEDVGSIFCLREEDIGKDVYIMLIFIFIIFINR